MKPVISVEFRARAGNYEFDEESITLHDTEELLAFVAPGGGCQHIPSEVEEIRFVFVPPEHPNRANPVADLPVVLQMHCVVFTGALAQVTQTMERLQDAAGRGEVSEAFLRVSGLQG